MFDATFMVGDRAKKDDLIIYCEVEDSEDPWEFASLADVLWQDLFVIRNNGNGEFEFCGPALPDPMTLHALMNSTERDKLEIRDFVV